MNMRNVLPAEGTASNQDMHHMRKLIDLELLHMHRIRNLDHNHNKLPIDLDLPAHPTLQVDPIT